MDEKKRGKPSRKVKKTNWIIKNENEPFEKRKNVRKRKKKDF